MTQRKPAKQYRPPSGRTGGRAGASRAPAAPAGLTPDLMLAGALALLVGLAPAFRGLYFAPQQSVAAIVAAAIAGGVWWYRGRRDGRFARTPLDWAALGITAAYFLSMFVGVAGDVAIQAWLLRCLYFAAFWSAAELALPSTRTRDVLLHGLLLGGVVVAATGLIGAAGGVPAAAFFVGRRIYTSIQYPDAAAAYLAAIAFIALGLGVASGSRWSRTAYVAVAALCLFSFLFALSRGATLVFVPVVILFMAAHGRRAGDAVAALVAAAVGVAAAAVPFAHGLSVAAARTHAAGATTAPGTGPTLAATILVLAVAAAADLGWQRLRRLPAQSFRPTALAVTAVLVLGGVGAAFRLHLANGVLARLGQDSLIQYNAWSRIAWWRDGLKMALARPILGWGGGGWGAAYRMYQSYGYSSTQVHNGWIQTFVATGAAGLILWVAFWALLLWSAWLAFRRGQAEDRPVVLGLAAACVLLGAHGFIDFTLSLGGISLSLFIAAGLLRALAVAPALPAPVPPARRRRGADPGAAFWPGLVVSGACAAVAIFALVQWAGLHALGAGDRLGVQSPQATADFQRAIADDPWSADAYYNLGLVDWNSAARQGASQTQVPTLLASAQTDFKKAVALRPFDPTLRDAYSQFLEVTGSSAAAVAQLQVAVKDAPYDAGQYENLTVALVSAAIGDATNKTKPDPAGARTYLAQITQVASALASRSASIPAPALREMKVANSPLAPFPATQPGVQLASGEAAAMEGQWSTATTILQALVSQPASIGGEAALWLGLVEQHLHQAGAAQALAKAQGLLGATTYQQQQTIVTSAIGAAAG